MPENEIARLTREALDPRKWSRTASILTAVSTPPFIALFRVIAEQSSPWAPTAAYAVLFLWGITDFLLLAWSKGASTIDTAKRIMVASGWRIRDVPYQLSTGMLIVALPILAVWFLVRPGLHPVDFWVVMPTLLFIWFVAVPHETFLQAWVWPMAMPLGPVAAQVTFLFLHGDRAFDPTFAALALILGFGFWAITFLRYLPWRGRRFFGPIAGWSAHATWNTVWIWVALSIPGLGA